jgi:hypothetical protein
LRTIAAKSGHQRSKSVRPGRLLRLAGCVHRMPSTAASADHCAPAAGAHLVHPMKSAQSEGNNESRRLQNARSN